MDRRHHPHHADRAEQETIEKPAGEAVQTPTGLDDLSDGRECHQQGNVQDQIQQDHGPA